MGRKGLQVDIDTTKRKELRFRETTTHTNNVVVVVGRRVVFVADDDDDDVSSSPAQVRRVFFSLSIFALWESSSPNCLNYVSLSRVCIFDDYLYSFFRVGPRDARSPRRAPPRKTRTRRHPPKRHRRWYRPTPRPSR